VTDDPGGCAIARGYAPRGADVAVILLAGAWLAVRRRRGTR